MSSVRVLALVIFCWFLIPWTLGAVWLARSSMPPLAGTLVCGAPLLVAAGLLLLVFRVMPGKPD